jgi:predicted transcriptional regulator of viral defense system
MKSLNKPYYVALLSAAAIFGSAHQQPMEYFVIAETPAPRSIANKKLKINFLSKNNWVQDGIIQQKTNAGYINVSLPELTALDFFAYNHKFGINRIVTVLQELVEEMKPATLAKIAKQYSNTSALQRLGYVLENVLSQEKLAGHLWKILNLRDYFMIPLSAQKEKKGEIDNKWKVIKNMEIDSDL